jgi:beta-lactamase regulating signal transducer with metallopeptidase domain
VGFGAAVASLRRTAAAAVGRAVGWRAPAAVDRVVGVLWVLASASVLVVIGTVHLRVRRARSRWPRAELHGVPVRLAPATGPAVIGLARAEIVVPRWLLALAPAEQRLVLAHEREHVRARDPLLLALGWGAVALVPWHPAVWWMLSRLRLAVELDCDARVLRQGAPRASYGALLIDLAGHGSGFHVGATALADTASHLERRLRTMTPRPTRFTAARAGALAAAALLAVLAACEAKLPTEADVARMNVASAEQGARRMTLILPSDSTAAYTLDGRSITSAEAHALAPEQIGQIRVMRKRVDGAPGTAEIDITSRKPGDVLVAGTTPKARTRFFLRTRDSTGAATVHSPGEKPDGEFEGLLVIDGEVAEASRLRTIPPDQIAVVEVVKGPEAAKQYADPAAAKGVIRITTKTGAGKR